MASRLIARRNRSSSQIALCRTKSAVALAAAVTAAAVLGSAATAVRAADIFKADNLDNLNLTTSWTLGVVPGTADVAVWDSTVSAANATDTLGANLSWLGLRIANPGGPVTITGANTLTLGANGIDMSAASQGLTISSTTLALLADTKQNWNVASGQALNISAALSRPTGATMAITNAGTINISSGTASTFLAQATTGAPYAVLNGTDWAALDASKNVAAGASVFAYVVPAGAGNITMATANATPVDVVNGTGVRLGNSTTITGGIRFNTNRGGDWAIDTASAGRLLTTGSILVTQNVGAFNVNVGGSGTGFRTSGNVSGGEFFIHQYNTLGDLVLNAGGTVNNNNSSTNATKDGPGRLILNSTQGNTGTWRILEGTVQLGNNSAAGALNAGSTVINKGTLAFNRTDAFPFANTISGSGAVNQIGSGTTTISSASNTYTGNTTVSAGGLVVSGTHTAATGGAYILSAGSLRIDGTLAGAGQNVTANGGILSGIGSIGGTSTINSGAKVEPGDSAMGTLTSNNVSLSSGSILNFEIASPASHDQINLGVAGTLTLAGGDLINLYQPGTTTPFATAGTYDLFQLGSGGVVGNPATAFTVANPVGSATYSFGVSGNLLQLTIGGGAVTSAWKFDVDGNWNDGTKWTNGVPSAAGDTANFPTNIPLSANHAVSLNVDETVTTMNFGSAGQAAPFSYTIGAGGGTLHLSVSTGAAAVNNVGGSHAIAAPVSLDSDTVFTNTNDTVASVPSVLTVSGAVGGAGSLTVAGTGTLILANDNNYAGNTTVNSGATLQIGNGGATGTFGGGSTITDNGTIVVNRTGSWSIGANIVGASGSLIKNGSSTLILTGNNTFGTTAGGLTVNNGLVQLGSATAMPASGRLTVNAGGTLDLNGNSITLSGLAGGDWPTVTLGGTITDTAGAAGNSSITITATGANQDFLGAINNGATRTLSFAKAGTGYLGIWNPNSNYTGGTSITGGILKVFGSGALGLGPVNVSTIGGLQLANNVTLANAITTNAGANEFLDVSGTDVATLSGAVTTQGSSQFRLGTSGGTIVMTGASTPLAGSLNFFTRGNVTYANSGSFSAPNGFTFGRSTSALNVIVKDSASLSATGTSGVTVQGGPGGTNANAGAITLTVQDNGVVSAGGTMNLGGAAATPGAVVINLKKGTGVGGALKAGSFILSNAAGTTALNLDGGSLVALGDDPVASQWLPAISNLTVNVSTLGGTIDDNAHLITIAQPLLHDAALGATVDGGLTKTGAGTTTLSAVSTYTGGTTASNGTLVVSSTGGLPSGTNLSANAAVQFSNAAQTIGTLNGTASGAVTADAGSVLTVSGLGAYAGAVNANGTVHFSGNTGIGAYTRSVGQVNIGNGGLVVLDASTFPYTPSVLTAAGVSFLNGTSTLNLTNNELFITGTTLAAVVPQIISGNYFTTSTGGAIGSLQVGADVELRFTLLGDTNLDGKVDVTDLGNLAGNYGATSGATWVQGDTNYSGAVDVTDLGNLAGNYGGQLAAGPSAGEGGDFIAASMATVASASGASVPEPTTLGLLGIGVIGLPGRRRRVR